MMQLIDLDNAMMHLSHYLKHQSSRNSSNDIGRAICELWFVWTFFILYQKREINTDSAFACYFTFHDSSFFFSLDGKKIPKQSSMSTKDISFSNLFIDIIL